MQNQPIKKQYNHESLENLYISVVERLKESKAALDRGMKLVNQAESATIKNHFANLQALYIFVEDVIAKVKAPYDRWMKFAVKYDIHEGDTIKNYFDILLVYIAEYLATAELYKEVLKFIASYPFAAQETQYRINEAGNFLNKLQLLKDETVRAIKPTASLQELVAAIQDLLPLLHEHYLNSRYFMLDDSYSLQSLTFTIALPANYKNSAHFSLLSPLSQDKFNRAIGICANYPPPVFANLHEQVKLLQKCETEDSSHKGIMTVAKLEKNINKVETIRDKVHQLTELPTLKGPITFLAEALTAIFNEAANLPSPEVNLAITQSAESAQLVRRRAKSHMSRQERVPSVINLESSGSISPKTPHSDDSSSPKSPDFFATLYRKMSIKKKPNQDVKQDKSLVQKPSKPLPAIPIASSSINKPLPDTPRGKDQPEAASNQLVVEVPVNKVKNAARFFETKIAEQYKPVVDQLDDQFGRDAEPVADLDSVTQQNS